MPDACSDCGVTAEAEKKGRRRNDEIKSREVFIRKVRRMAKKVRSKKEKLRSDRGKIALAARLSSQYYRELWTHKSTSVLGP